MNKDTFQGNFKFPDISQGYGAAEVDIVIYHDKCPDGKAAAWPFWREYHARNFIGLSHGQNPPNVDGKKVMIVDFCFSRATLLNMAKTARKITILDHHESAQKDLEGELPSNIETVFDMNRSGAQIAWDYVYPGETRPWFIDVIADRDLWVWKIPNSRELGKALSAKGYYTWEKMEEMYQMTNFPRTVELFKIDMIKAGTVYIEQEDREISMICSKAILAEFITPSKEKYKVKLVGCPSNHRSEVGNRLCDDRDRPDIDFAVLWQYDFLLDEWWISCRGRSTRINLSEICKQFDRGGGHPNAAGFTIFGSDRIITIDGVSTTKLGEKLQTYFKPLEVPKNRPRDFDLI